MIDLFDGNTIEIINFSKHQNLEEIERRRELTRARTIKYRDKIKSNALVTRHTVTVTTTDKIRQDKIRQDKTYTSEFLIFYQAYPKHKAKNDAWKAWKQQTGNRPAIDILLKAIENQKQSDEWQKDNGQFIPLPATWLRGGRWDDEIESPKDNLITWAQRSMESENATK